MSDLPLQEQARLLRERVGSVVLTPAQAQHTLDLLTAFHGLLEQNRLKYFIPHRPQLEFLAAEEKFTVLLGGNQVGKTTIGAVKACRCLFGDDEAWQLFKWHRQPDNSYGESHIVRARERGGQHGRCYCTDIDSGIFEVTWPKLKEFIPDELILQAPTTAKPILRVKGGGELHWKVYTQDPERQQGASLDFAWVDESIPLAHWGELLERFNTRPRFHIWMTLTPLKGVDHWLYDLYTDPGKWMWGQDEIRFIFCEIDDVPDAIFSSETKAAKHRQHGHWADETKTQWVGTEEGKARVAGRFFLQTGLVYDAFDRNVHAIEPFEIPWDKCLLLRTMDHGVTNPTAVAWWAVLPTGEIVMYREYYQKGRTIGENVRQIVEMSGNRLEMVEKEPEFYVEHFDREQYLWTLLDWHVWEPEAATQRPVADEYIRKGLSVRPSSQAREMSRYEAVRKLLEVDPRRKHLQYGTDGGPRLYVFRSCRWFLWEISRYTWDRRTGRYMTERNPKERARDRDNHLMDAMEYMAVENPAWFPPEEIWKGDYDYKPVVSSMTGY